MVLKGNSGTVLMNSFPISILRYQKDKRTMAKVQVILLATKSSVISLLYLAKESKTLQEWKWVQVISYFYFYFYFKLDQGLLEFSSPWLDILCTFFQLLQLLKSVSKKLILSLDANLCYRGYLKSLYLFQN